MERAKKSVVVSNVVRNRIVSRNAASGVLSIAAGVTTMMIGSSAMGATKTWGTTAANTWDTGLTLAWNANSATWANNDDAVFSNGVANTVTLSGSVIANSITQTTNGTVTTISGGTGIQIDGAAGIVNSGNSALTVNSALTLNNTITVNAGNAINLGGAIGQLGLTRGITKIGGNTLTLGGTNTYDGATTITQGTLRFLADTGSAAGSAVTVGSTGSANAVKVQFDHTGQVAGATTTRAASLTFTGGQGGGNGYSSLQLTGVNTTGVNTVDRITGALTTNAGAFVYFGTSALANVNQELRAGSFTRNAGSIFTGRGDVGNAAFGTINRVNLRFDTAPTLFGNLSGADTGINKGVIVGAFNNQVIATYDSTNGLRALNTGTEMSTLTSGWATPTANAKLTNGAGPLVLTGDTTVNSLQLGLTSGNGATTSGTGKLIVTSGMIAVGQGSTLGNAELAFGTAEGIIQVANTRVLTINSIITGSNGLTLGTENATTGSATIILNGANTYTGTTRIVSNGASGVKLTHSLALQNSTLDYNNYGASFTFGNGTTTGQTAYTFGGLQGGQNINLNNNNTTVAAVALTVGGNDASTTYSGVFSDSVDGGSLIKVGIGTLTLTGANVYAGATTLTGGVLSTGSTGALANGGAVSSIGNSTNTAANLVLNGGTLQYASAGAAASTDRLFTLTTNGGKLDASGTNAVTFAGNGAGAANAIAYSGSGARTLTLTGGNTGANTLAPILADGTGGATGLTKSGLGTWQLSNTNTYTGTTNITAGKLALTSTGSINNSATITVGGGATFDVSAVSGYTLVSGQTMNGTGTVVGAMTVGSGAVIAPGNSPGILNTGTINLVGQYTADLNGTTAGTGYDQLNVVGGVTLSGNLLALLGYAPTAGDNLFILNNDGIDPVAGNFNNAPLGTVLTLGYGGNNYDLAVSYVGDFGTNSTVGGNDVVLTVLAIPEPATFAMLSIGALGLLRRRGRRDN